jgi:hypothetical protein
MLRGLAIAAVLVGLAPVALAQDTSKKPHLQKPEPLRVQATPQGQLEQKSGDAAAKPTPRRPDRTQYTVDRYMRYYDRMYKLTPEQKTQFRGVLEGLAEEQRDYLKDQEQVFGELQKKLQEAQAANRSTEVPPEIQEEMRQTLESMRDRMPLSDENVQSRLENILPPPQIEEGRRRLEEQRRRQQTDARAKQYRESIERNQVQGMVRVEGPKPDAPQVARSQAGGTPTAKPAPQQSPAVKPATPAPSAPLDTKVLHPWESYGERFIAHYRLEPAQRDQVRAIVADLLSQRDDYEAKHEADYDALEKITDQKRRAEEQSALERPVNEMFESLKRRLENIPTTAQLENTGEFK